MIPGGWELIVIIGVLGFMLDAAFERLRGWLVRWAEPPGDIAVGLA